MFVGRNECGGREYKRDSRDVNVNVDKFSNWKCLLNVRALLQSCPNGCFREDCGLVLSWSASVVALPFTDFALLER